MTSDNDTTRATHDEVFALLPWHANGTLDDTAQAHVDAHVAQCATCQGEIDWLASLNDEMGTIADARYAEHANVERDLSAVMKRIADTQSSTEAPATVKASTHTLATLWWQRVIGVIESLTVPQWTAVAAAVLVAVLVVPTLTSPPSPENAYRVLSGQDANETSRRLAIDLVDGVAATDTGRQHLAELLADWPAQLAGEPDDAGRLIVDLPASIDVQALSELMLALKNDTRVQSVELLP